MKTRSFYLLGALLLAACGSTNRNPNQHAATAGSSAGGAPATANGGDGAGGDGDSEACPSNVGLSVPAGLVRLSFGEVNASLTQLFGADAAAIIAQELELDAAKDAFPPLAATSEGTIITDTRFLTGDKLAQNAGAYVREHFEAVTKCAATYACVTDFVTTFAQRAFRRALTSDEQSAVERVVVGAEALGAPPEQGAEYGVYAVLESPHFLYRTELGPSAAAAATGELRLSDDELASSLSFFLTGAPPDQALLDAASAHDLGGPDQLAPHVERLLASAAGRQHLERTLGNYLGRPNLQTVVIDPAVYPDFNRGVVGSMDRELTLFLKNTLWKQPVSGLLTSRTANVNATLAALYGVQLPTSGLDADGFAEVELPENRAGWLTRAGALTARSRPDGPSVVGRAIWVASTFTCAELPPFPENMADLLATLPDQPPPGASQRELAEYRMETEPCDSCHVEFDQYGLALDEFDGVGRYRSTDAQGRPIDPAVELPAKVGGAKVTGGAELSKALSGEIFAACLTKSFLQYALGFAADSKAARCEAKSLATAENPTFTDLLSSVALSRAFATRTR